MTAGSILLLESARTGALSLSTPLQKRGYAVRVEHTARAVLRSAELSPPDVVLVDAASLKRSGLRLCRTLRAALADTPIVLVTSASATPSPVNGDATLVLVQPFTPRKLLNGVARLLPPGEKDSLTAGPIRLNLKERRVACNGRVEQLTPRQAQLLAAFLRAPGKLLTRQFLIHEVWQTDFMGDTRTLDVHMSWLRRALEADPRRPRYLRTLRGGGYWLDAFPD